MAEKDVTKKLLVLLVILVALSLVVDLVSLNVLYGISNKTGLKGSLASESYTRFYDYASGCDAVFYPDHESSCLDDCLYDFYACKFNACTTEFSCRDSLSSEICSKQQGIGDDFCYFENEECEKGCNPYYYSSN